MKSKLFLLLFVLVFTPVMFLNAARTGVQPQACGSTSGGVQNVQDILCKVGEILGAVVPIIVALAVVFLVWGIVQFVIADEAEAKEKGKDTIIYGIIGLAVIVSIWGLVGVVQNTFGLENIKQFDLPTIGY
jgi:hypothetical protein